MLEMPPITRVFFLTAAIALACVTFACGGSEEPAPSPKQDSNDTVTTTGSPLPSRTSSSGCTVASSDGYSDCCQPFSLKYCLK